MTPAPIRVIIWNNALGTKLGEYKDAETMAQAILDGSLIFNAGDAITFVAANKGEQVK